MENAQSIWEWQNETFGTPTDELVMWDRTMEEFMEVRDEIVQANTHDKDNRHIWHHEKLEECADTFIVLTGLIGTILTNAGKVDANGAPEWSLFFDAVNSKMAKNRKRKWNVTPEGTGYHE